MILNELRKKLGKGKVKEALKAALACCFED